MNILSVEYEQGRKWTYENGKIYLNGEEEKNYYEIIQKSYPYDEEEWQYFLEFITCDIEPISGVYCIKVDGKIVYIGKSTNLERRWLEHKTGIYMQKRQSKNMYKDLYSIEDKSRIQFEVLLAEDDLDNYNKDDYKQWNKSRKSMLDHAEFILISLFKPKYNTEGVNKPYRKCIPQKNCYV